MEYTNLPDNMKRTFAKGVIARIVAKPTRNGENITVVLTTGVRHRWIKTPDASKFVAFKDAVLPQKPAEMASEVVIAPLPDKVEDSEFQIVNA